MLRDLRLKALEHIGDVRTCLSTSGPGGLQATMVACRVWGACLYLLLPEGSDHLFNLEHAPELLLTTEVWQLRGLGICLPQRQHLGDPFDLIRAAAATGRVVVEVVPLRIHLGCGSTPAYRETIDFSCPPPAAHELE